MKNKVVQALGWNLDNSYSALPKIYYTSQEPTLVRQPNLIILNHSLARELGLDPEDLQRREGIEILSGNALPEGSFPIAQAYAGHQFGHFTMLGDGRALLIGEQITPRGKRVDIQLKGSGKTTYSRGGDGRAALGPMLREYIISEAMLGLRIPTTRSLAVVTTGEQVYRETPLTGAVLTRVAASHIRVGTFQFAAKWASEEECKALADYTWQRHFSDAEEGDNRYLSLLKQVIARQADLIAKWQLVGFIHGVMNTDNMAVSGETIDYGPCAFMDTYDPATVFSSIDVRGRYAYGNQPAIAHWNLTRFAETLLPLIEKDQEKAKKIALDALEGFTSQFRNAWLRGMREKLGLLGEEKEDELLIADLLEIMHVHQADFTNTFRLLTLERPEELPMHGTEEFIAWQRRWAERLNRDQNMLGTSSLELMKKSNPSVIPRNHRVEEALKAATEDGNFEVMHRLLEVLADPFAYTPEQEAYADLAESTGCKYKTFCGT